MREYLREDSRFIEVTGTAINEKKQKSQRRSEKYWQESQKYFAIASDKPVHVNKSWKPKPVFASFDSDATAPRSSQSKRCRKLYFHDTDDRYVDATIPYVRSRFSRSENREVDRQPTSFSMSRSRFSRSENREVDRQPTSTSMPRFSESRYINNNDMQDDIASTHSFNSKCVSESRCENNNDVQDDKNSNRSFKSKWDEGTEENGAMQGFSENKYGNHNDVQDEDNKESNQSFKSKLDDRVEDNVAVNGDDGAEANVAIQGDDRPEDNVSIQRDDKDDRTEDNGDMQRAESAEDNAAIHGDDRTEENGSMQRDDRVEDNVAIQGEMLEQSADELKTTVEELEKRFDAIENEDDEYNEFASGNEWKTRYETQTEMNQQLERQILMLENKVEESRKNLKDVGKSPQGGTFLDELVNANPQMVKQFEKEKIGLVNQIRDLEWRLDQESKAYHKANDERKQYVIEIQSTKGNIYHMQRQRAAGDATYRTPRENGGNIPDDQRILDPKKGPIRRTAGVKTLPSLDSV